MNIVTLLKSVKTTVLGIAIGVGIIAPQIVALLDGDDATIFSLKIFLGGLAAMGLGIAAKDGDKSTEELK